jgi:alanine-synthesizing transaminase
MYRIRLLPAYVFAEVNAVTGARAHAGEEITDRFHGNPDTAPPTHLRRRLQLKAQRYSALRGVWDLRGSQASYCQRRFGVELYPDGEVILTRCSKEFGQPRLGDHRA